MGTDINVSLGRFLVPQEIEPIEPNQIALMLGKIPLTSVKIEKCPSEIEPSRCYKLFSWLSDVGGNTLPFLGCKERKEATAVFISKWLQANNLSDLWPLNGGDFGYTLYLLTELTTFDYDQPYQTLDLRWYPHQQIEKEIIATYPETYRDMFEDDWFKLLEYAKENKYDFLLFGYD